MFEFFSRLIRREDQLTRLSRGSDRHAFVDALGKSDIVLLSTPFESGLDPDSLTPEQLLAAIEAAAKDLSSRTKFELFGYSAGMGRRTPIFSQPKYAEHFVQNYVREVERVIPFQTLTVQGSTLAPTVTPIDSVVLNDRSACEYELSAEDIRLFKERWT